GRPADGLGETLLELANGALEVGGGRARRSLSRRARQERIHATAEIVKGRFAARRGGRPRHDGGNLGLEPADRFLEAGAALRRGAGPAEPLDGGPRGLV